LISHESMMFSWASFCVIVEFIISTSIDFFLHSFFSFSLSSKFWFSDSDSYFSSLSSFSINSWLIKDQYNINRRNSYQTLIFWLIFCLIFWKIHQLQFSFYSWLLKQKKLREYSHLRSQTLSNEHKRFNLSDRLIIDEWSIIYWL